MLDKKLKGKWLRALRSGKFKQGRCELVQRKGKEGDLRYCCLGVLCVAAGYKPKPRFRHSTTMGFRIGRRFADSLIPECSRLGKQLRCTVTCDELQNVQGTLSRMNDELRASFKRIATWIDQNL